MANTITYTPGINENAGVHIQLASSDGTLQNILCGFEPSYVEVHDLTTVTDSYVWTANMAAGKAIHYGTTGTVAVASNGVTVLNQNSSSGIGFSLGTSILTNAHSYDIFAWR